MIRAYTAPWTQTAVRIPHPASRLWLSFYYDYIYGTAKELRVAVCKRFPEDWLQTWQRGGRHNYSCRGARGIFPFKATICLTNIARERSHASGAIRPTLKTVHLQLSAVPLATRPLAAACPCHARPTYQPTVSPATQRPTSPNSASGRYEKPLPGMARALPWKVENRKKAQIPPSSCRTAVLPWWIGRYVLLHCCCTVVVVPLLVLLLLLVTTAFVSKKKTAFCGRDLA